MSAFTVRGIVTKTVKLCGIPHAKLVLEDSPDPMLHTYFSKGIFYSQEFVNYRKGTILKLAFEGQENSAKLIDYCIEEK